MLEPLPDLYSMPSAPVSAAPGLRERHAWEQRAFPAGTRGNEGRFSGHNVTRTQGVTETHCMRQLFSTQHGPDCGISPCRRAFDGTHAAALPGSVVLQMVDGVVCLLPQRMVCWMSPAAGRA